MRNTIDRFRNLFFSALDEKPSWGRDQIKELFLIKLTQALLGMGKDDGKTS